jgi:hypothetical protein
VRTAGMNPVATSTSSPGTTQASEGRLEAPKAVAALIGHHPYGKLALVAGTPRFASHRSRGLGLRFRLFPLYSTPMDIDDPS